MANLANMIYDELESRLQASKNRLCDGIEINMKHDGQTLTIIPCFENPTDEPENPANLCLDKADWVLVIGTGAAVRMGGEPRKVCEQLADYENLCKEHDKDVLKLVEYCRAHHKEPHDSDTYTWYSDWHKSVYGFRPCGWTVGISRNN